MAEEKLSAVSFDVLFVVSASGRGWAGSGRAERSGEAVGGWPVSHVAAAGEMQGWDWNSSGRAG